MGPLLYARKQPDNYGMEKERRAAPIMIKIRLSAGKILITVFSYFRTVLHTDFLHERRANNSTYEYVFPNKTKFSGIQDFPI